MSSTYVLADADTTQIFERRATPTTIPSAVAMRMPSKATRSELMSPTVSARALLSPDEYDSGLAAISNPAARVR